MTHSKYPKKRLLLAIPLLPLTILLMFFVWLGSVSEKFLDALYMFITDIFPSE